MGGTHSKSTAVSLTESLTDVVMSSIMSCTTSATQSQLVKLENIEGNVLIEDTDFTQASSVSVECIMNSQKQNEIANKVANALAQKAEAEGQAVLSALGSTSATAQSIIKNKITNKISDETKIELKTNMEQLQEIKAVNIGGDFVMRGTTFEQSAKAAARSLLHSEAYSSAVNEVATAIDQETKAKEKGPLDFIGDIMKGWGLIIAIVAVVLVILLAVGGFIFLKFMK